ncbi:S41 family peptidase [Flaviaesturariibacter terrae]
MNRAAQFLFAVLLASTARAQQQLTPADLREDFDALWTTVREQYAYWPGKKTDWNCVRETYRPQLDTIRTRAQFTGFLERVLRELYDQHVGLNSNTAASYRLVPTGADLALRLAGPRAFITEVRPRSGAERAGIRAGMEVLAIDGLPIEEALRPLLPRCLSTPDPAARLFALQLLLAGTHNRPRRLRLGGSNGSAEYAPDAAFNIDSFSYNGLLEARVLEGGIGYIAINNSLGDEDLVPAFDSVIDRMAGSTRALILDLRETPSGGNTAVARALMGRLITREGYYQRHELPSDSGRFGARRSWVEIVSPRGKAYTKPVALLAGAWTGSMGEGIVIGLHALGRAELFGHPMAGLNGAIYSFRLPHSGIGYNLSAERLYHVDGTARERFRRIHETPPAPAGTDATLQAARAWLAAHAR